MNGIRRVIVVGTGLMAPGIARACVQAGAEAVVVGRSFERAQAVAAAAGVTAAPFAADAFSGADLALETIVEDLAVKHELLARVEGWLGRNAFLATNTSSLPIGDLARPLARPERFAGMHFMNPADETAVVELIPGARTAPETIEALRDLGTRMGKQPLVARDVPGFLWNRLQSALLREALWLLENGVADVATIDAAIADGLAPRWLAGGPFATVDLGGIDTWARVQQLLFPVLSAAHDSGELQRRAAEGGSFYAWSDEARARVAALRADTLAAGRTLAARRRDATPPPTP